MPPPTKHPEPLNQISNIRVEPLQLNFLLTLAEALNTTLDLQTLMHRVADLVRAVIDYRIFAILLIDDRTHELRMRFQTGHTPAVERTRVKLGTGVVGQAALHRHSILVDDVTLYPHYVNANPHVCSELAVPLIIKNKVIGVLDIEAEQKNFFTAEHQRLLELVASRMAVAVENARLYTRVSRQAQTLTVLNEISREITSILQPDDLLERIGTLLKRVVDFQMFTILLWNDRTQQFEHRFSTRHGERIVRQRNVALGVGLIGTAAQTREPILAPDTRKDPRYLEANHETRSEISVPLIYKGNVIGVLDLEHTRVNYFNEDHQRTLVTLAAQIAISIANAKLYQRIHEEEQRMERDLEMARQVQLRLMPSTPPRIRNAELAAHFLPARSIGGDIYDFLDYSPQRTLSPDQAPTTSEEDFPAVDTTTQSRTAIAVGDVSGKAAPAALYAALVSGILRSTAARRLPPADALASLNNALQERKLDSQYVTMLFSVWNDDTRTLQIANAGSVQPILVTRRPSPTKPDHFDTEVKTIETEGFPLGLFPNISYDELTIQTQPGDLIIFFSDGIVDAENANHEMFGPDRLSDCLRRQKKPTAKSTLAAILKCVATFQAGTPHFDDESVVVLHVL